MDGGPEYRESKQEAAGVPKHIRYIHKRKRRGVNAKNLMLGLLIGRGVEPSVCAGQAFCRGT